MCRTGSEDVRIFCVNRPLDFSFLTDGIDRMSATLCREDVTYSDDEQSPRYKYFGLEQSILPPP